MDANDEITISDAMIDAGFAELSRSGIVDDLGKEERLVVARIYRAMAQISREEARPPSVAPSTS